MDIERLGLQLVVIVCLFWCGAWEVFSLGGKGSESSRALGALDGILDFSERWFFLLDTPGQSFIFRSTLFKWYSGSRAEKRAVS